MAAYVGVVVVTDSTSPVDASVTVPEGATFCVVCISGWRNATNWLNPSQFTLNGAAFTNIIDGDSQADQEQAWLGYLANPTSGQLAGTFTATGLQGLIFTLIFANEVDAASPIKDSDLHLTAGDLSITGLNSEAGDLSIGFLANYQNDATITGGTERSDSGTFNEDRGIVNTGDGVTSFTCTNENFGTLLAVVLRNATAGGETGSGDMPAAVAQVAGAGILGIVAGAGANAPAQTPTIAGDGVLGLSGTGALPVAVATLAGSGSVNNQPSAITGSGDAPALTPTAAGAAVRGVQDTGGVAELAASVPTVAGTGVINTAGQNITGTGALSRGAPLVAGVGDVTSVGTGALVVAAATVAGLGERIITGVGALQVQTPTVAGNSVSGNERVGTGALAPVLVLVAGAGARGVSVGATVAARTPRLYAAVAVNGVYPGAKPLLPDGRQYACPRPLKSPLRAA